MIQGSAVALIDPCLDAVVTATEIRPLDCRPISNRHAPLLFRVVFRRAPGGGQRFEFPASLCYFVSSTADERPSVKHRPVLTKLSTAHGGEGGMFLVCLASRCCRWCTSPLLKFNCSPCCPFCQPYCTRREREIQISVPPGTRLVVVVFFLRSLGVRL